MSVLINPYALSPVAPAATLEYRALKSASNQNAVTLTVPACDIGSAAVGRYVFALFFFVVDGADRTVVGATIGGVDAAAHAQAQYRSSTGRFCVALVSAPLDAGATANVSITLNSSRSCTNIRCATYKVVGLQSNTPVATVAQSESSGSSTHAHTIDVAAGGIVIAGMSTQRGSDVAWSGLTEDFDSQIASGYNYQGASLEVDATESGFAFSTFNTNGSYSHSSGMVAGSFR